METCPNCGHDIRSTARFCTSCGYRVPERSAEELAAVLSRPSSSEGAQTASPWAPPPTNGNDGSAARLAEAGNGESTSWTATSRPTVTTPEENASTASQSSNPETALVVATDDAITALDDEPETIADISENHLRLALYHTERLRQILPDLSGWSEEQADHINAAIQTMEKALEGRENQEEPPFHGLRATVEAAKKDPRDIDVMIALSDRRADIEQLLEAHDAYSVGIRRSLISLKPIAVNYVSVPKAPARKRSSSSRSRSTRSSSSKAETATSKSTESAPKTTRSRSTRSSSSEAGSSASK